jgi:hypothetical protein
MNDGRSGLAEYLVAVTLGLLTYDPRSLFRKPLILLGDRIEVV